MTTVHREDLADKEGEDGDLANSTSMPPKMKVTKRSIVTLLVLVFINLLNYMDRYTVSGQWIFVFLSSVLTGRSLSRYFSNI